MAGQESVQRNKSSQERHGYVGVLVSGGKIKHISMQIYRHICIYVLKEGKNESLVWQRTMEENKIVEIAIK